MDNENNCENCSKKYNVPVGKEKSWEAVACSPKCDIALGGNEMKRNKCCDCGYILDIYQESCHMCGCKCLEQLGPNACPTCGEERILEECGDDDCSKPCLVCEKCDTTTRVKTHV